MPRTAANAHSATPRRARSAHQNGDCQRLMNMLRRKAANDPFLAGLLAEMEGEETARRSEFSPDFPTSPVENLSDDPARTSLASDPIFPPRPPFFGPGGGKIGVADGEIMAAPTCEMGAQVPAEQSVATSSELLDASREDESQGRLNHQRGEGGGGKILEDGELFILPGPSAEQSLLLPKQRVQRGRARVVDAELQTRIVSLMSAGLSLRQAAAKVGVHHTTILDAMRRDRELAEQVSEARTEGVSQPLAVVIKAARTNWRAAAWLAKHLQNQLYKRDCPPEERALERR